MLFSSILWVGLLKNVLLRSSENNFPVRASLERPIKTRCRKKFHIVSLTCPDMKLLSEKVTLLTALERHGQCWSRTCSFSCSQLSSAIFELCWIRLTASDLRSDTACGNRSNTTEWSSPYPWGRYNLSPNFPIAHRSSISQKLLSSMNVKSGGKIICGKLNPLMLIAMVKRRSYSNACVLQIY